ncbi:hypothetical protein D1AOALGA4SA_3512 [Olavius algarvensis Delta 1 endosymbiont]|nr:hypothetical protein D1AOALGA4SA_3512 [Olavius algarvensis Delta 1 endosymbiont]
MQYLMIHDIRQEYFALDLDRYRLTFDDGLFSQYYYYPLFKDHPGKLTYFIATSFIRPGAVRSMFAGDYIPYLKSKKYMYRTFIEQRFEHFMTTEEIQELSAKGNVQIGVYSHLHDVIPSRSHSRKRKPLSQWKLERFQNSPEIARRDLSIRSKIAFQGFNFQDGSLSRRPGPEWEDYIKHDTEQCLKWMADNLGITTEWYCFPFNEHNEKLITILKSFGLKKFFAARPGKSTQICGRVDIDSLVPD